MTRRRHTAAWLILLIILVIGAIVRFWDLDSKPFMHDESLFAYYSYSLYDGFSYRYEPLLHGPVLLHLTAAAYALAGDSNFTARFWPAFMGTALILLAFPLRRRIGYAGGLAAAAMICLSPTLLYYSRFMRNDMPLLFFGMGLILAFTRWASREKSPAAAFFMVLFAGLMVCTKENAVFLFFTGGTYLLWLFLIDLLGGLKSHSSTWRRMRFNADTILLFLWTAIINCAAWIVLVLIGRRLFIDPETGVSFTGISRTTASFLVLAALGVTQAVLFLIIEDRRLGLGRERLGGAFARRCGRTWMAMLAGLFVSLALYAALFTTLFHFRWGFFEIYRETLAYWWGQHQEHRLKGPFHYYMFRLLIYETLPLAIAIAGAATTILRRWRLLLAFLIGEVLIAIFITEALRAWPFNIVWADAHLHMTRPWHLYAAAMLAYAGFCLSTAAILRREYFHGFLLWWTIFSVLEYSYAGEKVPWIGVHIAAPLILLAASEINRLLRWAMAPRHVIPKAVAVSIAAIAAIGLFMRHMDLAIEVSFNPERRANPAEMLVYNHTTPEFMQVMETIDRLAEETGRGTRLDMSITGEAGWPLNWYLRHYSRYLSPEPLESTDDNVIVMDLSQRTGLHRTFVEYHVEQLGLRQAWVPDPLRVKAMIAAAYPWTSDEEQVNRGKEDWKRFWRYFLHREPWNRLSEEALSEPYAILLLTRKEPARISPTQGAAP